MNRIVVIDPGHGGVNEGTIENGFCEKKMTLITAQAMYDELIKEENLTVYLTRTEDIDLSLKERAEFAKSVNADFFVSLHYNASLNHNLFGAETWIPIESMYNGISYKFSQIQLSKMQELGLFIRGIKTKTNDNNKNYYGIIRECVARNIPAVLIEHCHVDENRDSIFCDSEEELSALGVANARAIIEFLNQVDLEQSNEQVVTKTLYDETPPDFCKIEELEVDYTLREIKIRVNATDLDSPLLYYDYSLDGGNVYSQLFPWPGSNALAGEFKDSFTTVLEIPEGMKPEIIVRAYNMFDGFIESNQLSSFLIFEKEKDIRSEDEKIVENSYENFNEENRFEEDLTEEILINKNEVNKYEQINQISVFSLLCFFILVILFLFLCIIRKILKKRKKQKKYGKK